MSRRPPTFPARLLVGKRIARVELGAFQDTDGSWRTRPAIVFDDGSRAWFTVQEPGDDGEYGIRLFFRGRPARRST